MLLGLLVLIASAALGTTGATANRQCGPQPCAALEPGPCANAGIGGDGREELRGTGRGDELRGRGHHDVLLGFAGADCLFGGPGPDRLNGGKGADQLRGQAGADIFEGDSGADLLRGGPGPDLLSGGTGADGMLGGEGDDLLRAAGGSRDTVWCGRGDDRAVVDRLDRVRGCEAVTVRG
jgi:Ca2+-binding RTX toxin-like protein